MDGETLKKMREDADLTQEQLAIRVGVTRKTVNTHEKSEKIPKPKEKLYLFELGRNVTSQDVEKKEHIVNEPLTMEQRIAKEVVTQLMEEFEPLVELIYNTDKRVSLNNTIIQKLFYRDLDKNEIKLSEKGLKDGATG